MKSNPEFLRARAALTRGESYTLKNGCTLSHVDVLQLMKDCAMSKTEAIKRLAKYAAEENGDATHTYD